MNNIYNFDIELDYSTSFDNTKHYYINFYNLELFETLYKTFNSIFIYGFKLNRLSYICKSQNIDAILLPEKKDYYKPDDLDDEENDSLNHMIDQFLLDLYRIFKKYNYHINNLKNKYCEIEFEICKAQLIEKKFITSVNFNYFSNEFKSTTPYYNFNLYYIDKQTGNKIELNKLELINNCVNIRACW